MNLGHLTATKLVNQNSRHNTDHSTHDLYKKIIANAINGSWLQLFP